MYSCVLLLFLLGCRRDVLQDDGPEADSAALRPRTVDRRHIRQRKVDQERQEERQAGLLPIVSAFLSHSYVTLDCRVFMLVDLQPVLCKAP